MFDDLKAYFLENVVDSFVVYQSIKDDGKYGISHDLRAAVVAATALYHFREHVPHSIRKSRNMIATECPSYDLLGDIVNVSKHKILTKGRPKLMKAEDLYEQIVITSYEDDDGEYTNTEKLVEVKFVDGSKKDILEILTDVINYWGVELANQRILNSFKKFDYPAPPGSKYVPRDKASSLDIEVIQGVRFKQIMKLLKYDKTTGKAKPINLTGYKFNFKIYKPTYSVDIVLIHDKTGKTFKHTFDLSEKQASELHGLENDSQREDFMKRLALERQEEVSNLVQKAKGVLDKTEKK